MSYQKIS